MPLFISDEGRTLVPTALAVWERLIAPRGPADSIRGSEVVGREALEAYERSRAEAEIRGHALYSDLMDVHRRRHERQRQAGLRAIKSRRAAVERLGLPQVRESRLRDLEREEAQMQERLADQDKTLPDLCPMLVVRIAPDDALARRTQ